MHQKVAIMKAWAHASRARISTPAREKAQAFFEMLSEQREFCWEKLLAEFRRNYYDAFDEIVSVLFATDDPFIIYQCVQHADLNNPREVEVLQQIIRDCNPEKHQVSLLALAEKQVPAFTAALQEKQFLPAPVREALAR